VVYRAIVAATAWQNEPCQSDVHSHSTSSAASSVGCRCCAAVHFAAAKNRAISSGWNRSLRQIRTGRNLPFRTQALTVCGLTHNARATACSDKSCGTTGKTADITGLPLTDKPVDRYRLCRLIDKTRPNLARYELLIFMSTYFVANLQ
jgi:hypothetical protein